MLQERWPRHVILRSSIMYGPQSAVPVSRTLFLQFVSSALSQGEQAAQWPPAFCWECILKSGWHSYMDRPVFYRAASSVPETAQGAFCVSLWHSCSASAQCLHSAAGKSATFFSDEFRCPIYVQDIVHILQLIVERSSEGLPSKLYNLGGEERLSR